MSVNNKTQSMVCDWNEDHTDYGADSQIYKRYWGDYSPNSLIWVWFDNKDISPSDPSFVGTLDGKQETADIDLEQSFLQAHSLPIGVLNYKFNDGTKRDTLVIKVPAANKQGFIQYKIKWAPRDPSTTPSGLAPLWYYVEQYNQAGSEMDKKWGTIRALPEGITQDDIYSNGSQFGNNGSQFGKKRKVHNKNKLSSVNRDISYLKR
jgi:hypothetical protein